ncbi:hypothetical protein BGZ49_009971 [Haplosporangium sp. Z 27]|nr:hypothetical protein BGZ49_009971 [Haplosporangium sp. Z 27]
MTDSELSSSQYRRERVSSPLPPLPPPLSNSSSLNDIQHQQPSPRSPPPVKNRFPLSNISDQIAKAARRLSLATSSAKDKDNQNYNHPPLSPGLLRSGATSPDLKQKRNSTFEDYYNNYNLEDNNNNNNNSGSTSSSNTNNQFNGNNKNNKKNNSKEKKPLMKMDLFNLKSKNSSQVNIATSPPATFEKPLPGSPPPPPPSKETFWRGVMMRQSTMCTEDDYGFLSKQSQPQPQQQKQQQQQQKKAISSASASTSSSSTNASTTAPRDNSKPGTNLSGHTEIKHDGIKLDPPIIMQGHGQQQQNQQKRQVSSPEPPFVRPTSPTPPIYPQMQKLVAQQLNNHNLNLQPPRQTTERLASTMSEDLSRLSNNSFTESASSISDQSLQMEDVFDVYDEFSQDDGSRQSSLRNPSARGGDEESISFSSNSRPETKPLSALEKLQVQQKQRLQEQERLAELVLPLSGKNNRNFSRDISSPAQPGPTSSSNSSSSGAGAVASPAVAPSQQAGVTTAAASSVENGESTILDQLLLLAPGSNRPRLPSQVEWQKGLEQLQLNHKNATALTSSVGRQNSNSSKHGQESSESKSRRHSMPDMPRGQSREDQERQRGDNFRNPMLLSSSTSPTGGVDAGLSNYKRRSGYGDREQLLQQPPIQRQSISEMAVLDPTTIATTEPKEMRNNLNKAAAAVPSGKSVVSPVERKRDSDKDAVDTAFDEMLASLSLPAATRAQLESLPKDRKCAMLQSNDAHPTLYQTPQTMPPQFFVEALLEYSGKKKRTSRDQFMNAGPPPSSNKPLGLWKNMSATNLTSTSSSNFNGIDHSLNDNVNGFSVENSHYYQHPSPASSFQQHLTSLLGKSEKRTLEEREQVLKKLRVLIRNGSIRWTGEFIKVGGPLALLQYCRHLQRSEETKLGQREKLLHQVIQCIKAIVSLEGGVNSLIKESFFFPLMRTLALHSAPVMIPKSKDYNPNQKSKTDLFPGAAAGGGITATGTSEQQQQRPRSSSIPKPLQSRFGFSSSHSSPALSVDHVPTFSNAQGSVGILVAILSREPELRDQILRETISDQKSIGNDGGFEDNDGEATLKYSEWIGYLKEIIQVCGVETNASSSASYGDMKPKGAAGGLSKENMRKRRNSATLVPPSLTLVNSGAGGIKYEPGEDREVLAYLTAHLELVSKLMVDMFLSPSGLLFAKTIKDSQLGEYLEVLRSNNIQNQDLCAQIEDLAIQMSVVPSPAPASKPSCELPVLPPLDSVPYQQYQQQQLQKQQTLQAQQKRATSPIPLSSSEPSTYFHELHQYPSTDSKYGAQVASKTTVANIPSRSSSLESFTTERYTHNGNNNSSGSSNAVNGNSGVQRPLYGGAIARSNSQFKPSPSQLLSSQQQQPQSQQIGATGRTRKASVIGMTTNSNNNNHRHSSATPPLVTGPSRLQQQVNAKRSSLDGAIGRGLGTYSPIPPENRRSLIHEPYSRDMQHTPTRLSNLSSSFSTTPTPTTTSTSRRATVGETVVPLMSSSNSSSTTLPAFPQGVSLSYSPAVPPKNKNRPSSMDVKSSGGMPPRIEYTTTKLEQRPNVNNSKPPPPPVVSKSLLSSLDTDKSKDTTTIGGNEDSNVNTSEPLPHSIARTSSASTFGHGRKSSLNNADQMMSKTYSTDSENSSDEEEESVDDNTSSSNMLTIPAVSNGRGYGSNRSLDGSVGSSTCSSRTSSGFTATSTSSVSPPSTQTKKKSLMNNTAVKASLNEDVQPTTSSLPTSTTAKPFEKPVHEFQAVDFDTRIQEDVRKLALSSYNNKKNAAAAAAASSGNKIEIQATDPRVLEAPIVVPEDMSMIRHQYFRDQIERIVLPPMERRSVGNGQVEDVTPKTRPTLTTAATAPMISTNTPGTRRRSNAGSSGIPVLSPPLLTSSSSPMTSSPFALTGSKALLFEQKTTTTTSSVGESKLPQMGGVRRRSDDPTISTSTTAIPSPSSNTAGAPVSATGKGRISDRIKMFERS